MSRVRWRDIADDMLARIEGGEFPVGSRLPTSSQLAKQSGVSLVTAHKVLEELQRVGIVTRAGRRGTTVADRQKKKTGRIALIFDQIDFALNFPRPELLDAIHAGLGENYNLVICDAKASVHREIELLNQMAQESDGILCWPTGNELAAPAIAGLVARGTPLVLLDRIPGNVAADVVLTDSVSATRQAAEYLIGRGHRRIGLLTFDKPQLSTVLERCGTFEGIMAEHGITSPDLVRRLPASLEVEDRAHFAQVFDDALFALLHGPSPATAVFCVQDLLGAAVLRYAEASELRIPEDLEIVTFNDWPAHWLRRPWDAHRIAVQPRDMGKAAISRLLAQISGEAGDLGPHHIPTVFVPADSIVGAGYDLHLDRPLEI
jgi:LacI family transcriptional regulator, galactose operon repressor